MSLRNRINQFFNKPKSSSEAPKAHEPASDTPKEAVTWDTIAAERRDDDKPSITYEELYRLVRFPGSTPAKPDSPTSANPDSSTPPLPDEAALRPTDDAAPLSNESLLGEPISPELRAFKNFFKTDMRIKRELIDAAPKPIDDYNEADRMGYVEDAYRTFRDFEHDFLDIARDFDFGDRAKQATEAFFERGQQDFFLSDYGPGVAQKLYHKAFADMRPQFVEKVKDSFVGYIFLSDSLDNLGPVVDEASTINELLHAYHSCIMNSNRILEAVPVLAEKPASDGELIVLRGDHSGLGQQVFDSFPENFDVGVTDIVSADDHIMMMVRNRGHALTISSEPDSEDPFKIWVRYNIPKLCNEEMIKALPGLAGYTENGASGSFIVSRDQLGPSLVDFIAKVPTDMDIPY